MYERDTIAAIVTPTGAGGVAIVRISGNEALRIANSVFKGFPPDPESHRLYFGAVVTADEAVIDRSLGVHMRAPRSFTGEHVAELHCHGGTLLVRRVLAAVLAAGARAAERGEFTRRAFVNGKLDLAQAEAVVDLITARSPGALVAASAQLKGALSEEVCAIRDALIDIAARLEVTVDFSEEDIGEIDVARLSNDAESAIDRVNRLIASFRSGRLMREGARVVIAGKPNVGKSSLFNRLLGADRAIVTTIAGTTRDVIEETLDLESLPIVLIDTAGLRNANEPIEEAGISRARGMLTEADLVLVVFDASRPLDQEDQEVANAMRQLSCIYLLNKADLLTEVTAESISEELAIRCDSGLKVSATTGEGINALVDEIRNRLSEDSVATELVVIRERHAVALSSAGERIAEFLVGLRQGLPAEVIGVDIMFALEALGEIIGLTTSEDVLDRIFSEFCIGK